MNKLNKLLRLGQPLTEFNLTFLGLAVVVLPAALALLAVTLIATGH